MRAVLFEHLGGEDKVTPPQRLLVERCAMIQLRLALLDSRILDGSFTGYDSHTFLAWSNSLRRTLATLGVVAPTPPGPADAADALQSHLTALAQHAGPPA
jgi:hypothetical protein